MPKITFDSKIIIDSSSINDDLSFIYNFIEEHLVFFYFEQYFLNGNGWKVLQKLESDESLFSKIDSFINRYSISRSGLMDIAILAALEGANYHTEMRKLEDILNLDHWSSELTRYQANNRHDIYKSTGCWNFSEYLSYGREFVKHYPLEFKKFDEEFQKLIS